MEKLFFGMKGVVCFFDDVLIFGKNGSDHDTILLGVLDKLEDAGVTAKLKKCDFFKEEIKFLGFPINEKGIFADQMRLIRAH